MSGTLQQGIRHPVDKVFIEAQEYWDDVSGVPLRPEVVRKARQYELQEFRKHGVYSKVPEEECWRITGKPPFEIRWVDVHKGDMNCLEYRSRLVAQDIKTDRRDDLFAATPPSEALKLLLSFSVTE